MADIKSLALVVEGEETKLNETVDQLSAANEAAQAIRNRIADERAKAAKAVADYRAGTIDVGVAGIIQKAVDLDVADLEKMLAPAEARAAELTPVYQKARLAYDNARNAFEAAEKNIACEEFDRHIKAIEKTLCDAIAERYRMKHRTNNSTWDVWTPSPELKDAVEIQVVPFRS